MSFPRDAPFPARLAVVLLLLRLLARDLGVRALSYQSPSLRASRTLLSDKDTELYSGGDTSGLSSGRDIELLEASTTACRCVCITMLV